MIDVEVHQQLKALLREQGGESWPHHLTIGRLVARALRLQRSTLIQVGSGAAYQGQHRLSYLAAMMLWPNPVVLVASEPVQDLLCHVELPRLRDMMQLSKSVCSLSQWPGPDFDGILMLSPREWLRHQFEPQAPLANLIAELPLIIDGAEEVEDWTRSHLTQQLMPEDWDALLWMHPEQAALIRDTRAILTRDLFRRPPNPYGCLLVEESEQQALGGLLEQLAATAAHFSPRWAAFQAALPDMNWMVWAALNRVQGSFSLYAAPIDVGLELQSIWQQRPVVFLSGVLEPDPQGDRFRQRIGLAESVTCLQFSADRQAEAGPLYLPDGLPLPNTPEFEPVLLRELRQLINVSAPCPGLKVLLVDDLPLKARVAAHLAAEFGSRVKVEITDCQTNSILITGWQFWQEQQGQLPTPQLLAIATLPFPSLENPVVAARVAYYKQQKKDWFRLYLLPSALTHLQKAIAPTYQQKTLLALLDSRVLHRSYGKQILEAIGPYARLNYISTSGLQTEPYSILGS